MNRTLLIPDGWNAVAFDKTGGAHSETWQITGLGSVKRGGVLIAGTVLYAHVRYEYDAGVNGESPFTQFDVTILTGDQQATSNMEALVASYPTIATDAFAAELARNPLVITTKSAVGDTVYLDLTNATWDWAIKTGGTPVFEDTNGVRYTPTRMVAEWKLIAAGIGGRPAVTEQSFTAWLDDTAADARLNSLLASVQYNGQTSEATAYAAEVTSNPQLKVVKSLPTQTVGIAATLTAFGGLA